MKAFIRNNSLSLFFLTLFLLALTGQAIAGHDLHNEEAKAHGDDLISLGRYLTSSELRPGGDGELAVRVPPVHALHARHGLVPAARLAGVEGARQGRDRDQDEEQKIGGTPRPDSPLWARVGGLRTAIYSNSLADRDGAASSSARGSPSR